MGKLKPNRVAQGSNLFLNKLNRALGEVNADSSPSLPTSSPLFHSDRGFSFSQQEANFAIRLHSVITKQTSIPLTELLEWDSLSQYSKQEMLTALNYLIELGIVTTGTKNGRITINVDKSSESATWLNALTNYANYGRVIDVPTHQVLTKPQSNYTTPNNTVAASSGIKVESELKTKDPNLSNGGKRTSPVNAGRTIPRGFCVDSKRFGVLKEPQAYEDWGIRRRHSILCNLGIDHKQWNRDDPGTSIGLMPDWRQRCKDFYYKLDDVKDYAKFNPLAVYFPVKEKVKYYGVDFADSLSRYCPDVLKHHLSFLPRSRPLPMNSNEFRQFCIELIEATPKGRKRNETLHFLDQFYLSRWGNILAPMMPAFQWVVNQVPGDNTYLSCRHTKRHIMVFHYIKRNFGNWHHHEVLSGFYNNQTGEYFRCSNTMSGNYAYTKGFLLEKTDPDERLVYRYTYQRKTKDHDFSKSTPVYVPPEENLVACVSNKTPFIQDAIRGLIPLLHEVKAINDDIVFPNFDYTWLNAHRLLRLARLGYSLYDINLVAPFLNNPINFAPIVYLQQIYQSFPEYEKYGSRDMRQLLHQMLPNQYRIVDYICKPTYQHGWAHLIFNPFKELVNIWFEEVNPELGKLIPPSNVTKLDPNYCLRGRVPKYQRVD